MWMQILLAMEIDWTTYNKFLSILIKRTLSCLHSALLVWLMFVTTHKDGALKNSLLLIIFLWADSQNSIIFIVFSHMWNVGQTVLSRMFSKYMWLQLWFSNMPFYHKMWEHRSSRQERGGIKICTHSNMCTHEFIWQGDYVAW